VSKSTILSCLPPIPKTFLPTQIQVAVPCFSFYTGREGRADIMTDLLNAARAERSRLLQELRKISAFRQYEAVCAVVTAYVVVDGGAADATMRIASPVDAATPRTEREGSKATMIARAAENFLQDIKRRAQSPEIMRAVMAQGITLSGDNPLPALSSVLSHNALFDNIRGQGYGLVEWQSENTKMSRGMSPQELRDSGIIPQHAAVVGENLSAPIPPDNAAVPTEPDNVEVEDAE